MKVLFIGGTGIISSACSQLALTSGIDLYLLNRKKSMRQAPEGANLLSADIRSPETVTAAIKKMNFDAVVDWIAYTPDHIQTDFDLFYGRTAQYVFISSASAYQKPPETLPVTEATKLENPSWQYSRNKIACEELLRKKAASNDFPITIVRPSHTYERAYIPIHGGWTVIDRMLHGKDVIVHGDGTSLWTLTHNTDFARGFNGLLGNPNAIGEDFHITSDEWLTWDQITNLFGEAVGVTPKIVHIPSEVINAYDPDWGASLLGDKAYCGIFDNSKIKKFVPTFKAVVPFFEGVKDIIAWHLADPNYQNIDQNFNDLCDKLIASQICAYPNNQ